MIFSVAVMGSISTSRTALSEEIITKSSMPYCLGTKRDVMRTKYVVTPA